jgi:hypothetical protein
MLLVIVTVACAVTDIPPLVAVAVFVEVELVGESHTWSVPFFDGELWTSGIWTLPNPFDPKTAGLRITEYPSTKFQPG